MSEVLVLAVLRAFELERGVCDGEVVACAFAQLVDNAVAAGPSDSAETVTCAVTVTR